MTLGIKFICHISVLFTFYLSSVCACMSVCEPDRQTEDSL